MLQEDNREPGGLTVTGFIPTREGREVRIFYLEDSPPFVSISLWTVSAGPFDEPTGIEFTVATEDLPDLKEAIELAMALAAKETGKVSGSERPGTMGE